MKNYHGSCHCGSIAFNFKSTEITSAMHCDCSICTMKGALLTDFTVPQKQFEIICNSEYLSNYQFDSKIAKHYFCNQCGIFTFVETRLNPGEKRINLGCIRGIDLASLPVNKFDGKSL